jgi:hypothetical protein
VVFVVETLWSLLLVWVGFHTTAFIQDFEHSLHAIGVTVLVAGAAFMLMRLLRKRIDAQELALDPLAQPLPQATQAAPTVGTDAMVAELRVDVVERSNAKPQSQITPEERPNGVLPFVVSGEREMIR